MYRVFTNSGAGLPGLALGALLLLFCVSSASAQWVASGLGDTRVNRFCHASDGSLLAASKTGIFRSTDDGESWVATDVTEPTHSIVVGPDGDLLILTDTRLATSSDDGATWTTLTPPDQIDFIWYVHIAPDGTFLAINTPVVYYSQDKGQTWANGNTGLPSVPDVNAIVSTADGGLLCGTGGVSGGGIFRSTNGASWTSVFWAGANSDAMALGAADGLLLAAVSGMGIARSLDNGANWYSVNIDATVASDFLIDGNNAYLISGKKVYRSTDNAANWQLWNEGLDDYSRDIFKTNDGTILLGTNNGVLRRPGGSVTDVDEDVDVNLPTMQLYPNPAAAQATLTVDNPGDGGLEIEFIDAVGTLVRRMRIDAAQASSNQTLDLEGLPAGAYFVKVRTADHAVLQKLIVLP